MAGVAQDFVPLAAQLAVVRRFVHQTVDRWGVDARDVIQVVDELAANAVVHAGTRFTVSLSREPQGIRVEVADLSPRQPLVRQPTLDDTSGRGLSIVRTLSNSWGVRPAAGPGKVVWACIG